MSDKNDTSGKDFNRQAQDFVTRSIAEQVKAAQRAYDLAARFSRGEISSQAMIDEYVRFTSQETSRYTSDLAMLGLNYYKDWLALNLRYSNSFFEAVGAKRETSVSEASEPARRVEIELHAPIGQAALRSFVLENKRGGTADISFVVSEFTSLAGTIRLPLEIKPERFSLAPGEECTVSLRLPLPAGSVVSGQRYRATVTVHGYHDLELGLTVWADAPASDMEKNSAIPEAVKPAGKKKVTSRKAGSEEKAE